MDPELAKFLTTLLIAVVGVGGTALGAWINQRGARETVERTLRSQLGLSLAADRRALRDKRRERLQQSFERILNAATMLQGAIVARKVTWEGESVEARDERLAAALHEAIKDLDKQRIHLRLEQGMRPVVDKFDETFQSFQRTLAFEAFKKRYQLGSFWEQMQQAEQSVEAGVRELEGTMRAALEQLDQPIGD